MAIRIAGSNLVYFPVPKVACTSLKLFVYNVEFGRDFKPFEKSGRKVFIHNWRPDFGSYGFLESTPPTVAKMEAIAVVRDPVKRVLSAYQNRVVHHSELDEEMINKRVADALGVASRPQIDDFVIDIDKYSLLNSSIKHHVNPINFFLGHDLSYFHHVIPIEETSRFKDLVNKACGTSVEMRREQGGGKKVHFSDLSRKAQVKLLEYCAGDYALLRDYYSPPKLT